MIENTTALLKREPLQNLLYLTQHQRGFWAFDSEFLSSGRIGHKEDVHTVQFSDGNDAVVLESENELKTWLYNHHRVKVLYGFVVLPDLGSVEEWLGSDHVTYKTRGCQTIGTISYRSFKAVAYDCRPLLQSFGVRRLSDAGDIVGYPKLAKPEWLGLRQWKNPEEHRQFVRYAEADAVITSKIVQWLYQNFQADPQTHASAGTLAKDLFNLPKRLPCRKKTVQLSPLETRVRQSCFAGRSEGFRTGYMKNVVYNDVQSLYPISVCATHALEINRVEKCDPFDLIINPDVLDDLRFGWMEGTFESNRDLWAIPLRGRNNFYCTGTITGFFHTFDLAAAHAKILHVSHVYKPIFQKNPIHEKYVRLTLDRVEGRLKGTEKMYGKAVLNSLSGKIGQSHPIARTSNFYAYSTLLAHSHAVMSKLFDKCSSEVLAMDTDSIFSHNDMSKKWFELSEGKYSIPVIMDSKGQGDLAFFRSKNYILKTKNGYISAFHGWRYFYEDFLKLYDGVEELATRIDIKHTLLTRQKEALKMAKGRWRTRPIKLSLDKIKTLLKADPKRKRKNSDSYQLVIEKRSEPSQAWNYEELMSESENLIGYPMQTM
jgi:hypothetical protein